MRASDRFGQLIEERLLDFGKFRGIHYLKNVLHLIKEHDLFCTVDLGPITQKTEHDL